MNKAFDIEELLKNGKIKSELELERASIIERQLRLISKENPEAKVKRKKLRTLISDYENNHWRNQNEISETKINESEEAIAKAEAESNFIDSRKKLIRSKLKALGINQQELGRILDHDSKSYMSELMNGIVPFTLKDLVIISKLLKINLNKLISTELDEKEKSKIERKVKTLGKPTIKLNRENLQLINP